ncbi:hypothetical protein ACLKA7_002942 [Drosophila subpalustris]
MASKSGPKRQRKCKNCNCDNGDNLQATGNIEAEMRMGLAARQTDGNKAATTPHPTPYPPPSLSYILPYPWLRLHLQLRRRERQANGDTYNHAFYLAVHAR